jgi:RNA polymerase sigma factor (sigma-70 family)
MSAHPDTPSCDLLNQAAEVPEQNRPEQLFQQLVHDHHKRLYRFILKHIGQSADAEDLTQQTFLEAARTYASFRGESALSTWLYGIAMNLTRNYLSRAPHRKYQFEDEQSLDEMAVESANPENELASQQTLKALQRELNDLPEEMREVLLLVALEELSYEEAAVMLSIPIGTVRSRVSRARTRLKQRLLETGIELPF